MRRGIPLTDEDRAPWLEILRQALRERLVEGKDAVLACSALKPEYRAILKAAASDFEQEQAHAVGRSLGNDDAYVDGIAKDACHELGDERQARTRAGGSWASHTGSSEDSLSSSAEEDVESCMNGVREGEKLLSRIIFVYLKADVEVLTARLRARDRAGTHYMPASLLESQMQTLQIRNGEPGFITKDANTPPDVLVRQIVGEAGRPDL
jgi:gluconate kinase